MEWHNIDDSVFMATSGVRFSGLTPGESTWGFWCCPSYFYGNVCLCSPRVYLICFFDKSRQTTNILRPTLKVSLKISSIWQRVESKSLGNVVQSFPKWSYYAFWKIHGCYKRRKSREKDVSTHLALARKERGSRVEWGMCVVASLFWE